MNGPSLPGGSILDSNCTFEAAAVQLRQVPPVLRLFIAGRSEWLLGRFCRFRWRPARVPEIHEFIKDIEPERSTHRYRNDGQYPARNSHEPAPGINVPEGGCGPAHQLSELIDLLCATLRRRRPRLRHDGRTHRRVDPQMPRDIQRIGV